MGVEVIKGPEIVSREAKDQDGKPILGSNGKPCNFTEVCVTFENKTDVKKTGKVEIDAIWERPGKQPNKIEEICSEDKITIEPRKTKEICCPLGGWGESAIKNFGGRMKAYFTEKI